MSDRENVPAANLAGAAPDLYAALEACAKELQWMIDRHNQRSTEDGSYLYDHQTVHEAQCALAKARGEV